MNRRSQTNAQQQNWAHRLHSRAKQAIWWAVSVAAISLVSISDAPGADAPAAAGIVSRIHRHPVESRALAAVGYSKRLRALEVEFKRGGTYRYLEVPRSVYERLLAADSKAGFYNRHVRGKYRSVYVRPTRRR